MNSLLHAFLLLCGVAAHAQQPNIVRTDSSRIVTRLYPGGKEVKEYLTHKDRVYFRFYRNNRGNVTTTSTYTKAERPVGMTREYDDRGTLRYSIDHDHGQWLVPNPQDYPHYTLQARIKAKADHLIATMYGEKFLRQHAVWNVWGSAIYNSTLGGNWTDVLGEKPTRYLLRYDIRLDEEHVYPELIELQFDAIGTFIPDDVDQSYGFERLTTFPAKGMRLVYRDALATAERKSGAKTGSLTGYLTWERVPDPSWHPSWYPSGYFQGQYRFYVSVRTGTRQELHPKGRSRITTYYDVYVFNPWTGAFVEKKTMEAVNEWEANSGFRSGLRPKRERAGA
ncbi:hypothetical protein [Hymenobacter sp. APR13]|uniref:hypothetical protein n=1 Tax=Hymenobacter sp. APR13 TaxID=1356852 RepID=UPI0004E07233|nr:hypothetical protein [Hymenobacter sp. APR13]AII51820.1 hypothetical protein N008_07465 [Hymenobacter sp. APR13]